MGRWRRSRRRGTIRNPLTRATLAALLAAVSTLALGAALPAQATPAAVAARAPLPSDRLHFGISNGPGTELNWLIAAGVPWRYRYQYLAGGINNGGTAGDPCGANSGWQTWNSPAGQFVTNFISDSTAHSAIPVFTYYEIVQSNPSAGDESAELTKISTVCTMQRYWADFTVLMQKAGAYGGPVVGGVCTVPSARPLRRPTPSARSGASAPATATRRSPRSSRRARGRSAR